MITTHKQYVIEGWFGKSAYKEYVLIVPYWVQKRDIKPVLKMAEKYAKLSCKDISSEKPENYDEHFDKMMEYLKINPRVIGERIFKWYIHSCCNWIVEDITVDFKFQL